ncbi:helicase HerA-like domain-containing protein [Halovenus marina]|uniref:helicase HerA-like domain-containing protein n=1 Tax=Halovenus marina TaxID=3396621 RepID=UPI003F57F412
MDLVRLGGFPGLGRFWFWERESGMAVDVLDASGGDGFWVRCVAGFRLVSQSEEGRELWTRNLSKMSRYLRDSFTGFRLSVDFADSVSGDITGIEEEAEGLAGRSEELLSRKSELEASLSSLERSMSLQGSGSLDEVVEGRYKRIKQELEDLDEELDRVVSRLEFLKQLKGEWESKGYAVSVCFSVSNGFERTTETQFKSVVSRQLQDLKNRCDRSIKQKLQGEKFRLKFTELDTPHQLLQHFYTPLVHPEEDIDHHDLAGMLELYMAFADKDLEIDGLVREQAKAGAARSVNAVLQHLRKTGSADVSSVENTGPLIGNVSGTDMTFGVDLAEQPHFYVVGSTGSGKTYTKRVLLENCLVMEYNIVSITPRDFQAVSAFQKFDSEGTGLVGDYYLPGDELLLDEPDNFTEFFKGASFVSLKSLSPADRQNFVHDLFDSAADIGQTDTPVFVFLDEAHLFSDGESAESIQEAVRETRKFGVHIVLVTQSPMDFNRKYKHIRQNTVGNFFLQGEYWDYAQSYLENEKNIIGLNQGEAWFTGRGFSSIKLDIRKPLSRVEEVTRSTLQELDLLYQSENVNSELLTQHSDGEVFEKDGSNSLSDEQREVVEAIKDYIRRKDQLPSKNKVIECSPYGSSRTNRILSELQEESVLKTEEQERYGNTATVFRIDL